MIKCWNKLFGMICIYYFKSVVSHQGINLGENDSTEPYAKF